MWVVFLQLMACPETEPIAAPVVQRTDEGRAEWAPDARVGGRDVKRMNIDQLGAAITHVSGGLQWTDEEGNNNFDVLYGTLGGVDYLYSTVEDLSPSIIFEKFLKDAAAAVCTELVALEADGGGQVFLVDVDLGDTWESSSERIEANLRHLLLRFHGSRLTDQDLGVQPWSDLWRSVYSGTEDTHLAWRAVCVGLIRHPNFYTY
jgi:hypothetical protein